MAKGGGEVEAVWRTPFRRQKINFRPFSSADILNIVRLWNKINKIEETYHHHKETSSIIIFNKKLSDSRETARRFVSLNILLSHQGHSKWHCCVGRVYVPISISVTLYLYVIHCTDIVSLNCMSYRSAIFSVKEWRDLKTGGKGRSRLLKMGPFNRSYTNFYWSAIVSITECCRSTIFKLFDVNNHDLEKVTEGHSNWYDSKA